MKKGLLALAAATLLSTGMANAANPELYIRGAQFGWEANNCTAANKFTENNGVYTLKLDKLNGNFKISDKNWTATCNFGLASAGEIEMDKEYTLVTSATSGDMTPVGNWQNVTVTFNLATKTLKATGQAGEDVVTYAVHGQFLNAGWSSIDMKETSKDVWTTDAFTPTVLEGSFGIRKNTNGQQTAWLGGAGAQTLEVGKNITVAVGGSTNPSYVCEQGKSYVIEFNLGTGSVSMTEAGGAKYPETMYIIGNVNEGGFAPNNGIAMTSTEEGVFTGEALIGNEMLSGYGYFGFAEKLGASAADTEWSKMGARYGAASKDFKPVFTDKVATCDVAAGENSFKVAADKTFTFVLDLKNMKLTLTEKEVVPQPNKATIVYGDYKTYTPNAADYTWTADGKTGNELVAVNDVAFKAGEVTFTGTQNEAGTPCRLYRGKDNAASTTFRIFKLAKNKTNPSAYTVAVDNRHKINKIEIKVKGTVYPVNTSATTAKGEDGNGVMTWVAPEDQEVREVVFNGQANSGGTVSILSATVYYDLSTAVETIIDNEADAPVYYYNLQGVRVENPSNGIFIRVQGKKSQKVMF